MKTSIAARARELTRLIKRAGPYLVLEIVLPGGTLFALMLYLHRTGQLRKIGHAAEEAAGAIAFALQPAGSFANAGREDGLELKLLAAR